MLPIGRANMYYALPGNHRNFKPAPGMFRFAMLRADSAPPNTLVVGEAKSDYLAAKGAGCQFIAARLFFDWPDDFTPETLAPKAPYRFRFDHRRAFEQRNPQATLTLRRRSKG